MSESTTEEVVEQSTENKKPEQEAARTFDADYVKRLRDEAAKYRTEAKANSDAARRLAEIEDANKSELQKASDRLAAAERERDAARVDGLRLKVAVKHGISEDDAELFLTASDEDSLNRQATRLAEKEAKRKSDEDAADRKRRNVVTREGTSSPATESDERDTARRLFGGD